MCSDTVIHLAGGPELNQSFFEAESTFLKRIYSKVVVLDLDKFFKQATFEDRCVKLRKTISKAAKAEAEDDQE